MKKQYCIANWKMNKSFHDCEEFVTKLNNEFIYNGSEMVICPSFIHLNRMKFLTKNIKIDIGSQTISENKNGAYTGEISAEMLTDINIKYSIIGHSERRHLFNEKDIAIRNKIFNAARNQIKPILCIGETLKERKSNKTNEVLKMQIKIACETANFIDDNIIIAYEPVWAIGTGVAADLDTISKTHEQIRAFLPTFLKKSENISILYGGSVNNDNCRDIINLNDVDGFLIGGAALDAQMFLNIYNKMN